MHRSVRLMPPTIVLSSYERLCIEIALYHIYIAQRTNASWTNVRRDKYKWLEDTLHLSKGQIRTRANRVSGETQLQADIDDAIVVLLSKEEQLRSMAPPPPTPPGPPPLPIDPLPVVSKEEYTHLFITSLEWLLESSSISFNPSRHRRVISFVSNMLDAGRAIVQSSFSTPLCSYHQEYFSVFDGLADFACTNVFFALDALTSRYRSLDTMRDARTAKAAEAAFNTRRANLLRQLLPSWIELQQIHAGFGDSKLLGGKFWRTIFQSMCVTWKEFRFGYLRSDRILLNRMDTVVIDLSHEVRDTQDEVEPGHQYMLFIA